MKKILIIFLVLFFGIVISGMAQKRSSKKKQAEKELTEKEHFAQADLFMKAMSEKSLNNLEKANELLGKALEINAKDAATHYEKAKILQALGRKDRSQSPR